MPLRLGVLAESMRALTGLPELNLLAFGFLLHLPWELWLSGAETSGDSHLATSGELPLALSLAALAHAAIGVIAFWFVAACARNRSWIRTTGAGGTGIFVLASLLLTMIGESVVMGLLTQFEHPRLLPTFVARGLGFPSLLQGVVSPLLMIAVVRRQLGWPVEEASA